MSSAPASPRADGPTVVVGASGSIGRLVGRMIERSGHPTLVRVDIAPAAPDVHRADIEMPTPLVREQLAQAGAVVLATSFDVTRRALPTVLSLVRPECLIVETLSIKLPFVALLGETRTSNPAVGINPMFSGDLDPAGRPIAVIDHRNGADVDLLKAVAEAGPTLVPVSAAEHDSAVAVLQSLCHAAVLSFGRALTDSTVPPGLLAALSPPPFRLLTSLVARMTQNHPDVYWDIQSENPYAEGMRARLRQSLDELEELVAERGRQQFARELGATKAAIERIDPAAFGAARRIFQSVL